MVKGGGGGGGNSCLEAKNSCLVSARVPYRDDYVILLLRLHG